MKWDAFSADVAAVAREVSTVLRPGIEETARDIARRLRAGSKVLFCGNGGSAADAQHMAGEFVNRFLRERKPYAGLALSTDTSVLTAVANDYRYDEVFEKQVLALGRRGDVLVAFSTSGRARNVLRAVDAANRAGLLTVGITGGLGGPLKRRVRRCLCVASTRSTPRIQEGHLLILHALCQRIEEMVG